MRKILFRGKTARGEWVYGCLLNNKHDMIGFYNNAYKFEINVVIPETIGQFTGLTDKNGKKIFEGDIVSVKNIEHCVDFVGGSFVLTPITNAYVHAYLIEYYKLCEVIGNIHDNPELLEK